MYVYCTSYTYIHIYFMYVLYIFFTIDRRRFFTQNVNVSRKLEFFFFVSFFFFLIVQTQKFYQTSKLYPSSGNNFFFCHNTHAHTHKKKDCVK